MTSKQIVDFCKKIKIKVNIKKKIKKINKEKIKKINKEKIKKINKKKLIKENKSKDKILTILTGSAILTNFALYNQLREKEKEKLLKKI
jgi:hypothetical protein